MLKIKLNSCILSDILNELGYKNNILQNYKPNMKNNKLFGRVKPIQIRELKSNEDYTNIYKCLDSYESIHQGDIIFVNNLIDNKAYFGDLNATISISKNCQGTIINGYTRDINRTVELNYPTFFKNNTCSDVKFYGSLDYFDKPITVENITIYNNNLIFADIDGIVIIPKDKEDIILTKCKQIINLEENISSSIINGKSIKEIIKTDGFF
jgi:regulator of RNase E activity RraA